MGSQKKCTCSMMVFSLFFNLNFSYLLSTCQFLGGSAPPPLPPLKRFYMTVCTPTVSMSCTCNISYR